MHRCWSIADIVGEVCSQVYECFSWRHAHVTLATLARTSSVFQDPALDRLWHYQDTLENFFRCLPPDLVAFDEDNAGTGQKRKVVVRLLRPIVSSDWDRSRFYAHRVRKLRCYSDSLSLSQIFPVLSISLPDDLIFPNLHKLTWWHIPEGDYINLCLARTLTEISIWPTSAFQLSILSTLPRRCPALETLQIHGVPTSASDCFPLAQLPHLESLRMSVDDIATLEVIGKLRHLTSLTIYVFPGQLPSSVIYPFGFSNAQEITLLGVAPTTATEFFKTCMDASLTLVEVRFDSHPRTSALNQFCASLESCHHSHLSLTDLYITCPSPVEGIIASYAVDSATFCILFRFRNLTTVSIEAVSFDVDDAVLLEMACSWPRLVSLSLQLQAPPQTNHVTLCSLRSLARHCPDLRELEMTFDASAIPPPDTSSAHVSQTSLTSIESGYSPILAPFQVARFISGIFPCLEHIRTGRDYDTEDENEDQEAQTLIDKWHTVAMFIPMINEIREEGRMWAQSASVRPPTLNH